MTKRRHEGLREEAPIYSRMVNYVQRKTLPEVNLFTVGEKHFRAPDDPTKPYRGRFPKTPGIDPPSRRVVRKTVRKAVRAAAERDNQLWSLTKEFVARHIALHREAYRLAVHPEC